MRKSINVGRAAGVLLFAQFLMLMAGFVLLAPAVTSDYLQEAAGMEARVRAAVGFLMLGSAVTVGISIFLFPVVRRSSLPLAMVFVIAGVTWLIMQAVDNIQILSMLSISKRFAEATGAGADLYNFLAPQVRATRNWAHYTELLVIDLWFAIFYGILFAYRLIPRLIAAIFGLIPVALHLIGLPIAMFAGYPLIPNFAYGLLVSYLVIGGWLLIKGFPIADHTSATVEGVERQP